MHDGDTRVNNVNEVALPYVKLTKFFPIQWYNYMCDAVNVEVSRPAFNSINSGIAARIYDRLLIQVRK